MKLLNLKYKMHKLVNLIFYLIIFGIGFLLGFGAEKINFNKLISQFLFIDNVNAEETLYTNISCRDSKNLLNESFASYKHYIDSESGQLVSHNSCISGENYIEVLPNTRYTFSINDVAYRIRLSEYKKDKTHIKRNELGYSKFITITTTSETKYIRWSIHYGSEEGTQELLTSLKPQIEKGATITDYEPYGEKYCTSVDINIENNTFYEFAQKIFGEISEENKFIYDFITFGLVATCFILFVLVVGYIFNKFFGG